MVTDQPWVYGREKGFGTEYPSLCRVERRTSHVAPRLNCGVVVAEQKRHRTIICSVWIVPTTDQIVSPIANRPEQEEAADWDKGHWPYARKSVWTN